MFLHKGVFVGSMASSLVVSRQSFHTNISIEEYNQNSSLSKDLTEKGSGVSF
jgi:hypothetical protein